MNSRESKQVGDGFRGVVKIKVGDVENNIRGKGR